MKAIVLGAGGQLGAVLSHLIGKDSGVTRQDVSVADVDALEHLLRSRRPELVFNCAAYNAVDRAETERDLAYAVNAEGPANVARASARVGARLIHFSTNFVFDGALQRPYIESDQPAPLSTYAASKLEGERRVLELMPHALVVRTAALFGDTGSAIKGGSFPERILSRAQSGEALTVVADQMVNPTYTGDLAPAAMQLAESGLAGVVHVVAAGCVGWDEFARAVLAEFDVTVEVLPISTSTLRSAAARPLSGCLASTRVAPLRPWREGLHEWAVRHKTAQRPEQKQA